jgi:hypothetical protein
LEESEKLGSLESAIRELMIKIGNETIKLIREIDKGSDSDNDTKIRARLSNLEDLHSHCLITIDREIGFFGNN